MSARRNGTAGRCVWRERASLPLLALLGFYQRCLSPLKGIATCRYHPSCSQYMIDAIRAHGPLKGLAKGTWRLLRCHPFSRGGYDPAA